MARIGFKREYAAGLFGHGSVQALFMDIKAALVAAGFNLQLDTASETDALRMAAAPGTRDDDVPHWAFVFNDWGCGRTKQYLHDPSYGLVSGSSARNSGVVCL
jgi:hypothetical protein